MITTKKLLTTVEFAKTKENGILAIGKKSNSLTIQQLIAPRTVGVSLVDDQDNIQDLPRIEMNFYTIESVDVVILALQEIKESIKYPYGTIPLAC